MYASNYLETAILNLMRGIALSAPSALYVGLFLSDPKDSGTEGVEVSYTGYTRKLVTFELDGTSAIKNNDVITFPEAAESVSSPVTHIGIFDAISGGNMWLYGQLTTPLTIQAQISPIFRAGAIKWTIIGNMSTSYKQQILNTIRGQQDTVAAFTPYIGLCNGDPTGSGSELSGTDYARIPVTFSAPSTDTDAATATQVSNTTDISSPNPAGSYWGNWTYSGIYNKLSGEGLFMSVALNSTFVMNEGSVAGFRAGNLIVSVN